MRMRPFFTYLGGKYKLAARLGPPQRAHVIEPFAGSAGFSVFWNPRRVTLIERDPVIAAIWQYLIRVRASEILALPAHISHVDDLSPRVCQEARCLIGFWLNHGLAQPGRSRSNWAWEYRDYFWSEKIRRRLARQVGQIRHWRVIEGDYTGVPDLQGHWHIDAPYIGEAGRRYTHNEIDYQRLADWCLRRPGFAQVCEGAGATWLPFEEYAWISNRHRSGIHVETVFEAENDR
jgi:hypothetical protein